ncbi:6902_t:CDS:2, partial [Racocetra persica]
NLSCLLILDAFKEHLVDLIKQKFRENNTDLAIIPKGLSGKLQLLDINEINNISENNSIIKFDYNKFENNSKEIYLVYNNIDKQNYEEDDSIRNE